MKSERATAQSEIRAHLVQPLPHGIALCRKQPLTPISIRFGRDTLPEHPQLGDACFGALPEIIILRAIDFCLVF